MKSDGDTTGPGLAEALRALRARKGPATEADRPCPRSKPPELLEGQLELAAERDRLLRELKGLCELASELIVVCQPEDTGEPYNDEWTKASRLAEMLAGRLARLEAETWARGL
jgi:hypothetical protein